MWNLGKYLRQIPKSVYILLGAAVGVLVWSIVYAVTQTQGSPRPAPQPKLDQSLRTERPSREPVNLPCDHCFNWRTQEAPAYWIPLPEDAHLCPVTGVEGVRFMWTLDDMPTQTTPCDHMPWCVEWRWYNPDDSRIRWAHYSPVGGPTYQGDTNPETSGLWLVIHKDMTGGVQHPGIALRYREWWEAGGTLDDYDPMDPADAYFLRPIPEGEYE